MHNCTWCGSVFQQSADSCLSLSSSNQLTSVRAGAVQPDDDLALVSPARQALEGQLNLLQVEDPLSNL